MRTAIVLVSVLLMAPASDYFPEESAGKIEVFKGKKLFDYMNGGAELYLAYGFVEIAVSNDVISPGSSPLAQASSHTTSVTTEDRPPGTRETLTGLATIGYSLGPIAARRTGAAPRKRPAWWRRLLRRRRR